MGPADWLEGEKSHAKTILTQHQIGPTALCIVLKINPQHYPTRLYVQSSAEES